MAETEIRHIVRIAGKDLKGGLPIIRALTGVKGVSTALAKAITARAAEEMSIDGSMKLGLLDEKQTGELEEIVLNPGKHGIPTWMLNRQKDPEKGIDLHLSGSDLELTTKGDIDREKKIRSYRGVRHAAGLTVRGQRTQTSGRKGTTVGVTRRKDAHGSGK